MCLMEFTVRETYLERWSRKRDLPFYAAAGGYSKSHSRDLWHEFGVDEQHAAKRSGTEIMYEYDVRPRLDSGTSYNPSVLWRSGTALLIYS